MGAGTEMKGKSNQCLGFISFPRKSLSSWAGHSYTRTQNVPRRILEDIIFSCHGKALVVTLYNAKGAGGNVNWEAHCYIFH